MEPGRAVYSLQGALTRLVALTENAEATQRKQGTQRHLQTAGPSEDEGPTTPSLKNGHDTVQPIEEEPSRQTLALTQAPMRAPVQVHEDHSEAQAEMRAEQELQQQDPSLSFSYSSHHRAHGAPMVYPPAAPLEQGKGDSTPDAPAIPVPTSKPSYPGALQDISNAGSSTSTPQFTTGRRIHESPCKTRMAARYNAADPAPNIVRQYLTAAGADASVHQQRILGEWHAPSVAKS